VSRSVDVSPLRQMMSFFIFTHVSRGLFYALEKWKNFWVQDPTW